MSYRKQKTSLQHPKECVKRQEFKKRVLSLDFI